MRQISAFYQPQGQKQETKPDFLTFIRECFKRTVVINSFFQVFLATPQNRCYNQRCDGWLGCSSRAAASL